jgi:flavodoxin
MASTLIIYDSKYGCTKTYAKLIAEKLQAEVQSVDMALDTAIVQSDIIIF